MLYINKFNSSGDVVTALDNGTLLKPYLALVNGQLDYNTRHGVLPYEEQYLTFVFSTSGEVRPMNDYYHSFDDGETWSNGDFNVNAGDVVLFKGDVSQSSSDAGFWVTGNFSVQGNILSIYDSTGFTSRTTLRSTGDTFSRLFGYPNEPTCTGLTSAEHLVLPLTALTENCYENMFRGCYSLTTGPEIPDAVLAPACYQDMFNECQSLNYIKCLSTDSNIGDYTDGWTTGVSGTGTFVKDANMNDWPINTSSDYNGIPDGWTVVNAQ